MNNIERITDHYKFINDSTLREGEQFNSAKFSIEEQEQILNWLWLIGVDMAEMGNPVNDRLKPDITTLAKLENRPKLMVHIRANLEDMKATEGIGVEGIHILCTVDPDQLARMRKTGITLEDHIAEMKQIVAMAKERNLETRVSVEHGLEPKFFGDALKVLKVADSLGVDRVQIADTRGIMLPHEVFNIVSTLRAEINTQIGVHLHNDLGLAEANLLAALEAGANGGDTTLLGIGERTGIVALSRALLLLFRINPQLAVKYNLEYLTAAENYMAEILDKQVPHNLATSATAFSHKAGLHGRKIERQGPQTYEAFPPELVGNERVIVTDSRISGRKQHV